MMALTERTEYFLACSSSSATSVKNQLQNLVGFRISLSSLGLGFGSKAHQSQLLIIFSTAIVFALARTHRIQFRLLARRPD